MQPTTPLPILIVVLSLICSLRRLRRANLTFGKLPLGKLHSWEGFNIIRLQTVCSLNSTQRTQEFTADYKQGSISLPHISQHSMNIERFYIYCRKSGIALCIEGYLIFQSSLSGSILIPEKLKTCNFNT